MRRVLLWSYFIVCVSVDGKGHKVLSLIYFTFERQSQQKRQQFLCIFGGYFGQLL